MRKSERRSIRSIRRKRSIRKNISKNKKDRVISRLYGLNDKQTEYLYETDQKKKENKEEIKKYKRVKRETMKWFKEKIHTHEFRNEVFDFSALSGVREANAVMKDAFECVDDLIDRVVFNICDGSINYSKMMAIICACFSIALKLLSGPDWVYDISLMRELYKICMSYEEKNQKNKRCKSNILKMESDILHRTRWKPCKNIF